MITNLALCKSVCKCKKSRAKTNMSTNLLENKRKKLQKFTSSKTGATTEDS